ncbi:MAG: hypothetical protein ACON3Z_12850 [Bradymonadia bacterium]
MTKRPFRARLVLVASLFNPAALLAQPDTKSDVSDRANQAFDALEPKKTVAPRSKVQPSAQQSSSNPITPSLQFTGGGALVADGIGETIKAARTRATAALSRMILSRVNSTLTDEQTESDGRYRNRIDERTRIKTNLTLKGLTYSEGNQDKDGIQVRVTLSGPALAQTVEYLMGQTALSLEHLNASELDQRVVHLEHLSALLTVDLASGLSGYQTLKASVAKNQKETLRYRASGRIELRGLKPHDRVLFNRGSVTSTAQEGVYLVLPGEHVIEVRREGFKTIVKSVNAVRGQRIPITLDFIPSGPNTRPLYLHIDSSAAILETIAPTLLREHGVAPVMSPAPNAFSLRIEHSKTSAAGATLTTSPGAPVTQNELVVIIESFKGQQSFRVSRAKERFITDSRSEAALTRKMAIRLLKSLSAKLVPFLEQKGFFGGNAHDYTNEPPFK